MQGEIALYHHRPDQPRFDAKRRKPIKYEFPGGSKMAVDVHPLIRDKVRDPNIPLFVTEGVKKADAAISRGLCCIALLGVWNWRGANEFGGMTTLPDWDAIAFKAVHSVPRQLYLCFDSDAATNPAVYQAMMRAAALFKQRGANVTFICLPPGEDARKTGLDDYFAAGHGVDDLLALAVSEVKNPSVEEDQADARYEETPQGLVWNKPTKDGCIPTSLANFTARISAEVIEDNGVEAHRNFEIEASCRNHKTRFSVPAAAFAALNWVPEHLGSSAYVQPGLLVKEHARVAIQSLSTDTVEQRVYTHTGWRKQTDGAWLYLHGSGAIGQATQGPELPEPASPQNSGNMSVRLTGALEGFRLPEPPAAQPVPNEAQPAGVDSRVREQYPRADPAIPRNTPQLSALHAALRAHLRLWELGPSDICIPLCAAIYRAVLGAADFSLFLAGPSGAFKSETAALAQQHFGADMDSRHLPASWTSTENALEGLAFMAKDALTCW